MFHTPDRWLSKAGLASRGEVLSWIEASRLRLNGRLVSPGQVVDSPGSTSIRMILPAFTLDGVPLISPPPLLLIANKPRGVLVSRVDGEGRRLIGDLLPETPWSRGKFGAIRPLGRLDQASAGLILMTNFPELFSDFLDPSARTIRSYRVQILPSLRPGDRELFFSGKAGVHLGYDRIVVEEEKANKRSGWIRVRLSEGKNREVRNLLSSCGYRVSHLIRTAFGPFDLEGLAPGEMREVTGRVGEIGLEWVQWSSR